MTVTLNIDGLQFNKLVNSELDKLTDEQKSEILKECMIESIKRLMTDTNCTLISKAQYSGIEISELGKQLIDKIDVSNQLTALKDKMMNDLVEHHREITESVILNSLISNIAYSDTMHSALRNVIMSITNQRD